MPRAKTPRDYHGGRASHASRWLARALRANEVDGRTKLARFRRELTDAYLEHVGGKPTATQRALIDRIVFTELVCGAIENHTLKEGSPLGKDGALLPALAHGYATYSAGLARMLTALGLLPNEKPVIDLPAYLASRTNGTLDAQRGATRDAAPETNTEPSIDPDDATGATAADDTED